MGFTAQDIPDMTGKVVVITGANTGIGKISATELARKGAHVILACRSEEKTLPVVEEIKKETNNSKVEFMKLDLSSLKSVEEFSEAFHAKNLPLNVLLNNAGVMMCPYGQTADGIETQFGTNHVGHFYLTQLLFDVIEKSQPARIVALSSMAHTMTYSEGIRFDKINDEKSYSETKAYGQSKLANLLFAKELAKRCEGKQIYCNSVHPGYVATDLQRHIYDNWNPVFAFFARLGHSWIALSPMQGALTQLYVASHPDIESQKIAGGYFVPIAKKGESSAHGKNDDLSAKLWTFTEELLKEKLGEKYQSKI